MRGESWRSVVGGRLLYIFNLESFRPKRGQVWVETVIYTLIGLSIIGLVLAGALPKINQKKDEMTIGKSIEAMGIIDEKVYAVQKAQGSKRVINLEVRKGKLTVNVTGDEIYWDIPCSFEYSELDKEISFGRINVTTTRTAGYNVRLKLSYDANLTTADEGEGQLKQFSVAAVPYKIAIDNKGIENDQFVISITEV